MVATSRETGILINRGMTRGIQSFSVYDLLSRLIAFYETSVGSKTGDPAMVTEYKYDGNTSVIVATKESVTVWDSSYDFDEQP